MSDSTLPAPLFAQLAVMLAVISSAAIVMTGPLFSPFSDRDAAAVAGQAQPAIDPAP